MKNIEFGKLIKVPIREIWPNESQDFTPWLALNINELGKVLGLDLEVLKTEAEVGDFSVDILARDLGSSKYVIIDNQLDVTDHDHLGKLLTYASGFDASIIIWIAQTFRDEHKQALEWLNQRTDSDTQFFGIVLEIWKIDDSKPAYYFRPVVFPSEWRKSKKAFITSEKAERYRKYFQELIDELREKYKFTGARRGQPQNWYCFRSGFSGIQYCASFAQNNRVRTEIYIDTGEKEKNKKIFEILYKKKDEIEKELGIQLEWEKMEDKQGCRIALYRNGNIDEPNIEEIKKWHIEWLLKFKETFSKYLTEIKDIT